MYVYVANGPMRHLCAFNKNPGTTRQTRSYCSPGHGYMLVAASAAQ